MMLTQRSMDRSAAARHTTGRQQPLAELHRLARGFDLSMRIDEPASPDVSRLLPRPEVGRCGQGKRDKARDDMRLRLARRLNVLTGWGVGSV